MTNTIPRESTIVDRILKYLNGLPGCIARKRHGSAYGLKGEPDIYVIISVMRWRESVPGQFTGKFTSEMVPLHAEIEVKRPGKEPTLLQQKRLDQYRALGVPTLVATSLDEVKAFIEEIQR